MSGRERERERERERGFTQSSLYPLTLWRNIHVVLCRPWWTTLTSSESEHFKLWLRLIQTKSKLCWENFSVWQNSLSRLLATLRYKILIMQSRNFNSHTNLHFPTEIERENPLLPKPDLIFILFHLRDSCTYLLSSR